MKTQLLLFSLFGFFILNGCVSMSSLQTAQVLEKGKGRATVGGGYFASPSLTGGEDFKVPFMEVSYREGLADKIDAGVKATLPGSYTLDGKYQFLDGENFDAAIGLGVNYMSMSTSDSLGNKSESTLVDLFLPAYVSYKFSDEFTVYGSPRYVVRSQSGASSRSSSMVGGAGGVMIGKDWGAFLEAAYLKDTSSSYDAIQYNVSFFWNRDGYIKGLF